MLGKRARPMIGNLSELLVSGQKSGFWDPLRSPKTPLDLRSPNSPRGLTKRFDVGGVGLGIIASLEKSSSDSCKHAICSSNLSRSAAIVVNSGKDCDGFKGRFEGLEMDNLEDYTYVTSHHGPGKSSTKVYFFNGGEEQRCNLLGHDRNGFFGTVKETSSSSSTARFVEDVQYPTSDFLSSCHLCKKKLHGKDIYMYRGEKAFCSSECRSTHMMMDERKEKCKSKASKSAKNPSSEQIFSAGILAI